MTTTNSSAAERADGARWPHVRREPLGDGLHHGVAGFAPERLVDAREPVEVEQERDQTVGLRRLQPGRQAIEDAHAAGQLGEGVGVRLAASACTASTRSVTSRALSTKPPMAGLSGGPTRRPRGGATCRSRSAAAARPARRCPARPGWRATARSSGASSGCTSVSRSVPSRAPSSYPRMRAAAGLAYSTMPSGVTTQMMSAAFSTSAANRASVDADRAPGRRRDLLRARATSDTASISPTRSRWATITAEKGGTDGHRSCSVSRPRHRPYFTSAGSTLTS